MALVLDTSGLSEHGALIPQNDMAVAATCRALGYGVLVGPRDEGTSAEWRTWRSTSSRLEQRR